MEYSPIPNASVACKCCSKTQKQATQMKIKKAGQILFLYLCSEHTVHKKNRLFRPQAKK